MHDVTPEERQAYRVWIVRYRSEEWRPIAWSDAPPSAIAVEPADSNPFSSLEAAMFVEGFNAAMLAAEKPLWSIAIPVTIRYEGEPSPGDTLALGDTIALGAAAQAINGWRPAIISR